MDIIKFNEPRYNFGMKHHKVKDFFNKNHLESKILWNYLIVTICLFCFETIVYFLFLNNLNNFYEKYFWWIVYLSISVATIGTSLWHFYSYKTRVSCMLGMMIGMIMGMQTGMMIGAIYGATNGFFLGAVVGLILGVSVGIITGYCCGIMGILQGMMTGMMGGLMGPMITLMLISDHLMWFMPLYMFVNVLTLLGFSYMIFKELYEENVKIKEINILKLIIWSCFAILILTLIMIYGPKSPIIGG